MVTEEGSKSCYRNIPTYLLNGEFYIHVSLHRDSILITSNEKQQYAGVYLLQNYSTCFGCLSHPSSGVQKTVNCSLWYRS